jgi:hypothetical protein
MPYRNDENDERGVSPCCCLMGIVYLLVMIAGLKDLEENNPDLYYIILLFS